MPMPWSVEEEEEERRRKIKHKEIELYCVLCLEWLEIKISYPTLSLYIKITNMPRLKFSELLNKIRD